MYQNQIFSWSWVLSKVNRLGESKNWEKVIFFQNNFQGKQCARDAFFFVKKSDFLKFGNWKIMFFHFFEKKFDYEICVGVLIFFYWLECFLFFREYLSLTKSSWRVKILRKNIFFLPKIFNYRNVTGDHFFVAQADISTPAKLTILRRWNKFEKLFLS